MQFLFQITQSIISELKVMQKENPRWEVFPEDDYAQNFNNQNYERMFF